MPRSIRLAVCCAPLVVLALMPGHARAQDASIIEALAPVLAAEDARSWSPELFRRNLASPDSVVRSVTAMAIGRIGDLRGTALLLPLLSETDTTVRPAVAFALGLLRDSAAAAPLIARLSSPPALDDSTAREVATALAKIGGRRVGEFFGRVLQRSVVLPLAKPDLLLAQVAAESWRLGADAPTDELLPFASDTSAEVRWRAVYSLGRLRSKGAANALLRATSDPSSTVRGYAARALTHGYAQLAQLPDESVADRLARLTDDDDIQVRIIALHSLGTYKLPRFAPFALRHIDDPTGNVAVVATEALGDIGGSEASAALVKLLTGRRSFAQRREALLGLARADTAALFVALPPWTSSRDWRERAAAAEAAAAATGDGSRIAGALADRDGRVVGAALAAWAGAVKGADPSLIGTARPLLSHPDATVRSVAADAVARAASPADIPALAGMYAATRHDSVPDAAQSALGALAAIAKASAAGQEAVAAGFLRSSARPADYLLRRWAEQNWPDAADRWGDAFPIATGRTLADYRGIVRRFILPSSPDRSPHVTIETEQRGTIELALFAADAPLTVANFLQLVDRRFFDGNRWHRVVPGFVVQDGDPRGDGNGGPGGAIRDELNRHRYDTAVLGMALSGPDTGSSQWFINLSPQPHLDGTYTVFGQVVGNVGPLYRVVQGDLIRTIRR